MCDFKLSAPSMALLANLYIMVCRNTKLDLCDRLHLLIINTFIYIILFWGCVELKLKDV